MRTLALLVPLLAQDGQAPGAPALRLLDQDLHAPALEAVEDRRLSPGRDAGAQGWLIPLPPARPGEGQTHEGPEWGAGELLPAQR
jgi:hypothetical protein